MHVLQKQIVDNLRKTESMRYSELRPDDIESSHFNYHLDQLLRAGYLEQIEKGVYKLSLKGHSVVDQLSEKRIKPSQSPKVITYTLLYDDENYYLKKKDKEPYRNLLNMIGGKVHESETTLDAAIREIEEKTENKIENPDFCLTAEIMISKNDQLISHAIAYVYKKKVDSDNFKDLTIVKRDSFTDNESLAPDVFQIIEALMNAEKSNIVIIKNL